jgi:hypothetical protein
MLVPPLFVNDRDWADLQDPEMTGFLLYQWMFHVKEVNPIIIKNM